MFVFCWSVKIYGYDQTLRLAMTSVISRSLNFVMEFRKRNPACLLYTSSPLSAPASQALGQLLHSVQCIAATLVANRRSAKR